MLIKFEGNGEGPSRSAGTTCGRSNPTQITHVLRHVGYAAHRFESVSGPRRMYVCHMLAIAMVLADIAGDARRQPEERSRAEASLQAMTPQHILEAGLSVDFAEVGIPLFWQTSTSGRDRFWALSQLLSDLNVGAVLDFTAGSGQPARACLARGVQYTGMAERKP